MIYYRQIFYTQHKELAFPGRRIPEISLDLNLKSRRDKMGYWLKRTGAAAIFVFFLTQVLTMGMAEAAESKTAEGGAQVGDVNLFTGNLKFAYNLISLPQDNGKDMSIKLYYNSNIWEAAQNSSETSEASWVGLGWNLQFDRITWPGDGSWYYVFPDGSSSKIKGKDLVEKEFWKILQGGSGGWSRYDKDGTAYGFNHVPYDNIEGDYYLTWVMDPYVYYGDLYRNTLRINYITQGDKVYPDTLIDTAKRRIKFVLGSFEGKDVLDSIVIRDRQANVIRSFDFEYKTISCYGGNRLALSCITEIGKDGSQRPPTQFAYYEGGASDKDSTGVLKTITYPTGGKKALSYERRYAAGYQDTVREYRVERIETEDGMGGDSTQMAFLYGASVIMPIDSSHNYIGYKDVAVNLPGSSGETRYHFAIITKSDQDTLGSRADSVYFYNEEDDLVKRVVNNWEVKEYGVPYQIRLHSSQKSLDGVTSSIALLITTPMVSQTPS